MLQTTTPLKIYRSSAGSGKTYTLSMEYLKLILGEARDFRTVLAVTFTNKATEEMKSRILYFLYEIAREKDNYKATTLQKALNISHEQLKMRARATLQAILHDYSSFSVMTIDSFFQRVIRTFARDLGLNAGYTLELDQGAILSKVVDDFMEGLNEKQEKQTLNWLLQNVQRRMDDNFTWNPKDELTKLAHELFSEDYQRYLLNGVEQIASVQHISELYKQVTALRKTILSERQEIAREGMNRIEQQGLQIKDFFFKEKGPAGHLFQAAKGEWKAPNTYVQQVLGHEKEWYASRASRKQQIQIQAIEEELNEVLQNLVVHFYEHDARFHTANQVLKNIFPFGLLSKLDQQIKAYKNENDSILIAEAPVFLNRIIGEDELPFIYERIGTTYQHFLIDEFQDTSGLQWNNFKPLVSNSLATMSRNLIVGDVKQSIYRWRGGDWSLLLRDIVEAPEFGAMSELLNLSSNFRSRKNIVAFNNTVFLHLPEAIQNHVTGLYEADGGQSPVPDAGQAETDAWFKQESEIFTTAYNQAKQQLPPGYNHDKWAGRVEVTFKTAELLQSEELTYEEYIEQAIPDLIIRLLESGQQPGDIAILTRNNQEGKKIAEALLADKQERLQNNEVYYPYNVISPDSLMAQQAQVNGLLLDVLGVLNDPADEVAQASVIEKCGVLGILPEKELENWQVEITGLKADNNISKEELPALIGECFWKRMPEELRQHRVSLGKFPVYELVENLVRIFKLHEFAETAYLQTFLQSVYEFGFSTEGDVHSFLQWWADEGARKTAVQVNESLDAVQLMTIHQSKGLEFETVIVPHCNWEITLKKKGGNNNIMWVSTNESPFNVGPLPLDLSGDMKKTFFKKEYYQEIIKAGIDNLNLLYVAFTRAASSLYVYANPGITPSQTDKMKTVADLLYVVMKTPYQAADEYEVTLQMEEEQYVLGSNEALQKKAPPIPDDITPLHTRWRNRLAIRQLSRDFFGQADAQHIEGQAIVLNYGNLVHDLLFRIIHRDDAAHALDEVYFTHGISLREKEELSQRIRKVLDMPVVNNWFTDPGYRVINERTIIDKGGQEKRPDRVMVHKQETIIVDYKTGSNPADDTRSKYRNQVKQYKNLLIKMGYPQVKGYLLYTDLLQLEAV